MSNTIFNNITLTKKIKLKNKIIMYCGNTLPSGYVWCDGNNGTPNLINRFIYGISTGSIGDFGNSEINAIPNHNHSITANSVTRNIDKVVNTIDYRYLNRTGVPNVVGGAQKGNSSGAWSDKNHYHQVNNTTSNNSNAQNLGQTLDATINNSTNNNINQHYNNIQNTWVNNNVFPQKYIYIGFIMKV